MAGTACLETGDHQVVGDCLDREEMMDHLACRDHKDLWSVTITYYSIHYNLSTESGVRSQGGQFISIIRVLR